MRYRNPTFTAEIWHPITLFCHSRHLRFAKIPTNMSAPEYIPSHLTLEDLYKLSDNIYGLKPLVFSASMSRASAFDILQAGLSESCPYTSPTKKCWDEMLDLIYIRSIMVADPGSSAVSTSSD